jgi:hypothetical protein
MAAIVMAWAWAFVILSNATRLQRKTELTMGRVHDKVVTGAIFNEAVASMWMWMWSLIDCEAG